MSNDNAKVHQVAHAWLADFSTFLKNGDPSKVGPLFLQNGYWRDMLTFSWDFRTLGGVQNIQSYLAKGDALKKAKVSNVMLEGEASLVKVNAEITWIQGLFSFETAIATGRGVFRLSEDKDKSWKAHTVLTIIEELKGYEEKKFGTRPQGVDHGLNEGRQSWVKKRQQENEFEGREPQVVIIGAGQAGLMIGARVRQLNIDHLIIDKNERVGDNWRKRYEFLVLHDPVWYDHMPYIPFPPHWPVFTPKDKLADWLEQYSKSMELNVWTNSTVNKASYDPKAAAWTLDVTRGGKSRTLKPKHVILATGHSGEPNIPTFPGQEKFKGKICHSSQHTTGGKFTGKKAVVVGCCNSGHDIAHDFVEQGADTTIVQRSSTYIVSSDSILKYGLAPLYEEGGPPVEDADLLFAATPNKVNEIVAVNVTETCAEADKKTLEGLKKAGFSLSEGVGRGGFLMSYFKRGGGYYLDVGASAMIADGKIKVKQGHEIARFTEDSIVFDDGSTLKADIVVLATGYKNMKTTAQRILGKEADKMGEVWGLDDEGEIKTMWRPSGHPGLWAMGGNLALCRFNSRRLGLQIKARLEGIAPSKYTN